LFNISFIWKLKLFSNVFVIVLFNYSLSNLRKYYFQLKDVFYFHRNKLLIKWRWFSFWLSYWQRGLQTFLFRVYSSQVCTINSFSVSLFLFLISVYNFLFYFLLFFCLMVEWNAKLGLFDSPNRTWPNSENKLLILGE